VDGFEHVHAAAQIFSVECGARTEGLAFFSYDLEVSFPVPVVHYISK